MTQEHCKRRLFQSRAGFSLRRDGRSPPVRTGDVDVSIPCWVFSPPRRDSHTPTQTSGLGFQSRAGFSLRRDVGRVIVVAVLVLVSIPCWVFSPPRRHGLVGEFASERVSIPCWVFSPPRPNSPTSEGVRQRVSIPCWVFSPPRLQARAFGRKMDICFNPVLGFLSAATDAISSLLKFQTDARAKNFRLVR